MRRALREAGLWFAARRRRPAWSAPSAARELYRFLRENRARHASDWWGGLLESQLEAFAHGPVYRLVHDDLAEHWAPVWFADFAERAAAHGLAYVGDADLSDLLPRPRARRRSRSDAGRARGRRPDRRRAADRHPALRVLPPVRALPRQPPAGRRARSGRAAHAALRRARRASPATRSRRGAARLGAGAAALARAGHASPSPSCARRPAPTPTSSPRRCSRGSWPSS